MSACSFCESKDLKDYADDGSIVTICNECSQVIYIKEIAHEKLTNAQDANEEWVPNDVA